MYIISYSTLILLAGMQPLPTFILQPSWGEDDKINIVTELTRFLDARVPAPFYLNSMLSAEDICYDILTIDSALQNTYIYLFLSLCVYC